MNEESRFLNQKSYHEMPLKPLVNGSINVEFVDRNSFRLVTNTDFKYVTMIYTTDSSYHIPVIENVTKALAPEINAYSSTVSSTEVFTSDMYTKNEIDDMKETVDTFKENDSNYRR